MWLFLDPPKLSHPLVNLVIPHLIQDRNGSIKIGVVVAEDWPTWEIVLPSLGYLVLQIHAPLRFRKFVQRGPLSGYEWLRTNQARRISHLQYSLFFLSGSPSVFRQLCGGGINRDRMAVLMSVGYILRKFSGNTGPGD